MNFDKDPIFLLLTIKTVGSFNTRRKRYNITFFISRNSILIFHIIIFKDGEFICMYRVLQSFKLHTIIAKDATMMTPVATEYSPDANGRYGLLT